MILKLIAAWLLINIAIGLCLTVKFWGEEEAPPPKIKRQGGDEFDRDADWLEEDGE